jgi:hypothetical protein
MVQIRMFRRRRRALFGNKGYLEPGDALSDEKWVRCKMGPVQNGSGGGEHLSQAYVTQHGCRRCTYCCHHNRPLSMISSVTHPRWPPRWPSWISFPSIRTQTPRMGRLIRFLCGLLGLIRGRFLSMISSATYPNGRYSRHLGFGFR